MSFLNDLNYSNYYEVLDINSYASQDQIISAYIKTKKLYSPENNDLKKFFKAHEIEELIRMVDEAYYVLGEENSRNDYDSKIFGQTKRQSIEQMRKMKSAQNLAQKSNRHQNIAPSKSSSYVTEKTTHTTKFSTYEINENFEQKIETQEIFDGTFIAEVRKYKKISLESMGELTKITPSYLMAIESNDYESLPAPVFVRSYIKHVAKILELDPNKVSRSYMSLFK